MQIENFESHLKASFGSHFLLLKWRVEFWNKYSHYETIILSLIFFFWKKIQDFGQYLRGFVLSKLAWLQALKSIFFPAKLRSQCFGKKVFDWGCGFWSFLVYPYLQKLILMWNSFNPFRLKPLHWGLGLKLPHTTY